MLFRQTLNLDSNTSDDGISLTVMVNYSSCYSFTLISPLNLPRVISSILLCFSLLKFQILYFKLIGSHR